MKNSWWVGWNKTKKEPGPRINGIDILIGLFTLTTTFVLNKYNIILSYLPIYLFITFILFCNIFRITTKFEIIYCILFIISTISIIGIIPNKIDPTIYITGFFIQSILIIIAYHKNNLKGIWIK